MSKYIVRYSVLFVQQNISVSDELEVEDNDKYYDHDKQITLKVKDRESAEKFILSKYRENEDNIVIIPQSIWDSKEGLTDTELTIDSTTII